MDYLKSLILLWKRCSLMMLEELWKLIRRANKYIDETMPWKLAKEEEKR